MGKQSAAPASSKGNAEIRVKPYGLHNRGIVRRRPDGTTFELPPRRLGQPHFHVSLDRQLLSTSASRAARSKVEDDDDAGNDEEEELDMDGDEGAFDDLGAGEQPEPITAASAWQDKRSRLRENWQDLLQRDLDAFKEGSGGARLALSDLVPCDVPHCQSYGVTSHDRLTPHNLAVLGIDTREVRRITACRDHLPRLLMRVGLFPTSPLRPLYAVTFSVLFHHRSLFRTCCTPTDGLFESLIHVHDELHSDLTRDMPPPCHIQTYTQAFNWFCRFVAKRDASIDPLRTSNSAMQGPGGGVVERTPSLELFAARCPACFGRFLRPSSDALFTAPGMPDLFVSIDGNFQQKRTSRVDAETEASHEPAVILPPSAAVDMRRHFEGNPAPKDAKKHPCNNSFIAAGGSSKAAKGFYDVTGVMMMVCRHDVPLIACDIETPGESREYPLALINTLLSVMGERVTRVAIMYDIACSVRDSIKSRGLLPQHRDKIVWGVPLFHVYSHRIQCEALLSPRRLPGFGLTDGEGTERAWSGLSGLVRLTRSMGRFRRHEALETRMEVMATAKVPSLFKLMQSRLALLVRARLAPARKQLAWFESLWLPPTSEWRSAAREVPLPPKAFDRHIQWLKDLCLPSPLQLPSSLETAGASCEGASEPATLDGPQKSFWAALGLTSTEMLDDIFALIYARNLHQAKQDQDEMAQRAQACVDILAQRDYLARHSATSKAGKAAQSRLDKLCAEHPGLYNKAEPSMVLRGAAWQHLSNLHAVLADKHKETHRLDLTQGGTLGTRETTRLKVKRSKFVLEANKHRVAYNKLIDEIADTRPELCFPQLDEKSNLARVQRVLADWNFEDGGRPQPPWLTDSELDNCMDLCETLAQAAEEILLIRREMQSALAWLNARATDMSRLVRRSTPPELWFRKRSLVHLARLREGWASFNVAAWPDWSLTLPWPSAELFTCVPSKEQRHGGGLSAWEEDRAIEDESDGREEARCDLDLDPGSTVIEAEGLDG